MFKYIRSLFGGGSQREPNGSSARQPPANEVAGAGVPNLFLSQHIEQINGFPYLDWDAVYDWISGIPEPAEKAKAWAACELAWLEHMRAALGDKYHIVVQGEAVVLSSLEMNVSEATLYFMGGTLKKILRMLDGVAQAPEMGKDILIVFDDEDAYYAYVSRYYPEEGEFSKSGGMYIDAGCSHFVTVKSDLRNIEPIIAHEMTHGCVNHLPIPKWLNEGLAVNSELHLCPSGQPMFSPQEMHAKHISFWGVAEIQEFWSGASFHRTDDGNMLSYDLARILVSQLSKDWPRFRAFVLESNHEDAGAKAATAHLGVELGSAACALLERERLPAWEPNPAAWRSPQESEQVSLPAGSRDLLTVGGISWKN